MGAGRDRSRAEGPDDGRRGADLAGLGATAIKVSLNAEAGPTPTDAELRRSATRRIARPAGHRPRAGRRPGRARARRRGRRAGPHAVDTAVGRRVETAAARLRIVSTLDISRTAGTRLGIRDGARQPPSFPHGRRAGHLRHRSRQRADPCRHPHARGAPAPRGRASSPRRSCRRWSGRRSTSTRPPTSSRCDAARSKIQRSTNCGWSSARGASSPRR